MQLDHVNIHADDQEAMRDFFIALLGLEVGWRPSFREPGYWLYLGGRPVIHLWPRSTPHGRGWVDHIAFGPCGAPAARRAALEKLGFPFTESRLPDSDIVQFFVTGPEGVKIELQCR
jgi:catechol 2,3-dioxygenase-like lactoylglutathione lyase family enzyme